MLLDDNKIEKLLKIPPGNRTNQVLYYLLEPHLFGYWAFLEPKHKEIEIADILFIWEDVVVLFEAKTKSKPEKANEVWIKSNLNDAISTLNERSKLLKSGEVKGVRNKWRGILKWESLSIKHYYGVIILNHQSDPYDPRTVARDAFAKSEIPIQVFSFFDFSELLRFVNTPWDFIVYYELRHEYGRKNHLLVQKEFDIYQNILSDWPDLIISSKASQLSYEGLETEQKSLVENANVILKSESATEESYRRIAASFLLDLLLGSIAKKADQDETGKRVGSDEHDKLVNGMQSIAELSRRRRCHYGELWLNLAKESLNTNQSKHCVGYSPLRNRKYIMVAVLEQRLDNDLYFSNVAFNLMKKDNATSCLCIVATAKKIVRTFESLLASVKGLEESEILQDNEILDATVIYIDSVHN